MPLRDFYLILNPASDRGRAGGALPAVERSLRAAGARWELARTRHRGEAAELAERAAESGWPGVIAIGGDGVMHEVANGLLRAAGEGPTVPMGVVPAGSGNDFAKMLGIAPRRPGEAAARAAAAEPREVDVGWVERCVAERGPDGPFAFTNGIGLGLDARVAVEASRIRRLRGVAIYLAAVARTLTRLRTPRIRVELDGRVIADQPLLLVTLANGACHGGGFWLCPSASVEDGELDVLVADARGRWGAVVLVPRVMRGEHLGAEGVRLERGRRVLVTSEEPLPIHADGEIVAEGVRELSAELLPARLSVLA